MQAVPSTCAIMNLSLSLKENMKRDKKRKEFYSSKFDNNHEWSKLAPCARFLTNYWMSLLRSLTVELIMLNNRNAINKLGQKLHATNYRMPDFTAEIWHVTNHKIESCKNYHACMYAYKSGTDTLFSGIIRTNTMFDVRLLRCHRNVTVTLSTRDCYGVTGIWLLRCQRDTFDKYVVNTIRLNIQT